MKPANGCSAGVVGSRDATLGRRYEIEVALSNLDLEPEWIPLSVCALPLAHGLTSALLGLDFLAHFRLAFDGQNQTANLAW